MRNFYLCTALLCSLCLTTACSNDKNVGGVSSEQQVEQNKSMDSSTVTSNEQGEKSGTISTVPSSLDDGTHSVIDEQTANTMYKKAEEAFQWFDMATLVGDPAADTDFKEKDGKTYYKVEHPQFKTYSDLKNYLLTLFSEPITNRLLNLKDVSYCDIDGELYATAGARGSNIYMGNETYKLTKVTDTEYKYTVSVEVFEEPDGYETRKVDHIENHDFKIEYVENKWIFTDFYLFR